MGEQIFRTPGVLANEIDQTGPKPSTPSGTPAAVVGISKKGPAFIPITLPNFSEFISQFGDVSAEKFGALAMKQWFQNGQNAGTFMRLLGIGDGKTRTTTGDNQGRVTRAGFVVGNRLVEASLGGIPGNNPYAGATGDTVTLRRGIAGRTFILGCFMSESRSTDAQRDSMIFREAAIIDGPTGNGHETATNSAAAAVLTGSKPIIRGILMTPSGVIAALSGASHKNNTPLTSSAAAREAATTGVDANGGIMTFAVAHFDGAVGGPHDALCGGGGVGDVDITENGGEAFVLMLNGHDATVEYPSVITCSFDYTHPSHFATALNTDPADFEKKGHYLYAHWDIDPSFAVITGSNSTLSGTGVGNGSKVGTGATGDFNPKPIGRDIAFVVTASIGHNSGTATIDTGPSADQLVGIPNFDNFQDRYRDAFSPWVTSQKIWW